MRRSRLVQALVAANALVAGVVVVLAVAWWLDRSPGGGQPAVASETDGAPSDTQAVSAAGAGVTSAEATPTSVTAPTTTTEPDPSVWWPQAAVGTPYSSAVEGLLTFRGSPNRTYYGRGPVPASPAVAWQFPDGAMCSESTDGEGTRVWCGTGWTGQPAVWEREIGTWLAFGGYDRAVHFLDAKTGDRKLVDFPTGDLIKGSVTVDPDGFPLLYTGSRDNYYRILALDRGAEAVELWRIDGNGWEAGKWNNDWDGAGIILDDHLFLGGENSIFYIIALNRAYDADGKVTVAPEIVLATPGYDADLIAAVGNGVSIENSVAVSGRMVYFANGGGLVQGWDIGGLREGATPQRVFRFWAGDDIDASVVVDEEGMLYVGAEFERGNDRSREVGQIIKLDPSRPDDPLVWSIADHDVLPAGVWSTMALYEDIVIATTDTGRVLGIDRATGAVRWEKQFGSPVWSSPVVVDDVWIQGDCEGVLHGYDLSDTTVDPPELWAVELGGCIESTPAVWDGWIYVGTRGGFLHALH
jgi:outer membrane protein assembly factor BamB